MTLDEWYNELIDCYREYDPNAAVPSKESFAPMYLEEMTPDEAFQEELSNAGE